MFIFSTVTGLFLLKPRKLTPRDLKDANIGERWWETKLDAIPPQLSYRAPIIQYVQNIHTNIRDGTNLLLYGPYGSGKSGAAVIVAKYVLAHGGRAYMIDAQAVVEFSWRIDDPRNALLRSADLLVLDDLGTERDAEGSTQAIERLVRQRVANKLATAITTNLSQVDIDERYQGMFEGLRGSTITIEVSGCQWRDAESQALRQTLEEQKSESTQKTTNAVPPP